MEKAKKSAREKSFLIIAALYVVAIFIMVLVPALFFHYVFGATSIFTALVSLLIGDVLATLFIWSMGLVFKNSSLYDPYWSVMPPFLMLAAMLMGVEFHAEEIILLIVIIVWAIRLTYNWSVTWKDFSEEDWRYANMRKNQKTWFVANLFGIHLMPTFLVFFAMLPAMVVPLLLDSVSFNWWMLIGAVISIAAIVIECVADWQLRKFKKENANNTNVACNKGLWKFSRHPNYLGEISFWWGIYFMQLALFPAFWWMVFGPILITLLFIFASIPMAEKNLESNAGYAEYKARTAMLIPWAPKKDAVVETKAEFVKEEKAEKTPAAEPTKKAKPKGK